MLTTTQSHDAQDCGACETRMHLADIRSLALDGQTAIVTGANSGRFSG